MAFRPRHFWAGPRSVLPYGIGPKGVENRAHAPLPQPIWAQHQRPRQMQGRLLGSSYSTQQFT